MKDVQPFRTLMPAAAWVLFKPFECRPSLDPALSWTCCVWSATAWKRVGRLAGAGPTTWAAAEGWGLPSAVLSLYRFPLPPSCSPVR